MLFALSISLVLVSLILTSIAHQSIALTPSPYPSIYHKSCGYVTSRDSLVPNWQSSPDFKTMSAPNCGYIGTDPATCGKINSTDIGVQKKASCYARMNNEDDCPGRCASTPNCTHFKWPKNYFYLMSSVKAEHCLLQRILSELRAPKNLLGPLYLNRN